MFFCLSAVFALVESYANQGHYGQQNMEKKYPHIDFKKLLADAEFMQHLKERKATKTATHMAHSTQGTITPPT